ncbi:hypothetical protein HG530_010874 [Fusarium avenaceum]|nr:hypothetical protein HG530_010874 [Fusarium avenaceum]
MMSTPGAKMSTVLPQLEKSATAQFESTAPTVMALEAEPGDSLAESMPSLPDATTLTTPFLEAASTALLKAVDFSPPRDMLMTARQVRSFLMMSLTAQLKASRTIDVSDSSPWKTFRAKMVASFTTP